MANCDGDNMWSLCVIYGDYTLVGASIAQMMDLTTEAAAKEA